MTNVKALADFVAREARHAADFAQLSAACRGAWPATVRDILGEGIDSHARHLLQSAKARQTRVATDRRLPLAHPLDSDWRFTPQSANEALDTLLAATRPGRDILLIAMPTVALAAHDRGLTDRIVIASRHGDPIDIALRAAMPKARFDDLAAPPQRPFDTIGIDPPWYDDVASVLIETSLAQASDKGTIFVCIPDQFTLPTAAEKLAAVDQQPQAMGFAQSAKIGSLRYATPFFEVRCLEALGITSVDPCWRTGILVACRPHLPPVTRRAIKLRTAEGWQETNFGLARIWIRPSEDTELAQTQIWTATSISRSDPARKTAQLWTSGNTIARGLSRATLDIQSPELRPTQWPAPVVAALKAEVAAIRQTVDFE